MNLRQLRKVSTQLFSGNAFTSAQQQFQLSGQWPLSPLNFTSTWFEFVSFCDFVKHGEISILLNKLCLLFWLRFAISIGHYIQVIKMLDQIFERGRHLVKGTKKGNIIFAKSLIYDLITWTWFLRKTVKDKFTDTFTDTFTDKFKDTFNEGQQDPSTSE